MGLDTQLAALTKAIKDGKKVTFFVGAGISTSCGIPDFRSPKTGLYANLKRLNLPYPEAVFDIDYFRDSPRAFCTLCHELYPGKFMPSKFHYFMRLLQDKGLLQRVYTQNIDTLESLAGVRSENIVAAHGSFAENHCIDCGEDMSTERFSELLSDTGDGIPKCEECNGYVKPDIVFFGEGLPERFFDCWEEDGDAVEVAVVAGTSLTVYPFAGLPSECGRNALRVLINKELVGDFKSGKRQSDITVQKDCDLVAATIAEQLGWGDELQKLVDCERAKFAAKSRQKEAPAAPDSSSPKKDAHPAGPEPKEPKPDSAALATELAGDLAQDMQKGKDDRAGADGSVAEALQKLSL